MMSKSRRSGQSIVETVVGIMFLIPIVLFLLDIAVLVMTNTANDNLAKSVARAAASARNAETEEGDEDAAYSAAETTANTMAESSIINKPSGGSFLTAFCWNEDGSPSTKGAWPGSTPPPSEGNVAVVTTMTVRVPVPFPFLPNTIDFQAKAVEPVVSVAAGDNLADLNDSNSPFSSKKNNKTKKMKNSSPTSFGGGATGGTGGLGGASSSSSSSSGGMFGY